MLKDILDIQKTYFITGQKYVYTHTHTQKHTYLEKFF